jgi:FkbM family methyltransferase
MSRAGYLFTRFIKKALTHSKAVSYSQCGEDLIVSFLMNMLGISRPSYLDIGAHHPTYLSNTYLFYWRGCRGVCVEPDPELFKKIKRKRTGDKCLNVGVGSDADAVSEMDFYIMSSRTLNTFSKAEAERYQSYGNQKIQQVISIPLISVNDMIGKYFSPAPNFVSLDVEGLDLQIIQSMDFNKYRPEVFCIETLSYTENRTERKLNEIIDLMHQKNYVTYADTYINTIFVEKGAWTNSHRWGQDSGTDRSS